MNKKKTELHSNSNSDCCFRDYAKKDGIILIIIFVGVVLFKFNIITAPFHWDGLSNVRDSLWLAQGYIHIDRAPVLFLSLAWLYNIFGFSITLTHISIIAASILTLFFTYKLARFLFDYPTAVSAVLLLFFRRCFFLNPE